jgi:hypothetical protein
LREDYVLSQKQWDAQQVRAAPETPNVPEDEERDLKAGISQSEGLLSTNIPLAILTDILRS